MTTLAATHGNWEQVKAANPLNYYRSFLAQNIRPDGRTFLQRRPVSIRSGAITTSNGSCLTKIGATSVLAAIKLEVSPPLNATPTSGFLEVSVQLTPLCSPRFKVGKPSDEAFALQQHLQRVLVEGHVLDLEQLCIEEGKAVWNIKLDVICLNHDGGCDDAALLAAVGALQDLTLPTTITKVEDEQQSSRGVVVDIDPTGPVSALSLGGVPLPVTYGRIGKHWIVDPTAEEEEWMEALVTVVVGGGAGEEERVYSVYKPGGAPVAMASVEEALDNARHVSQEALAAMVGMSNEEE
jgi:exosome complex component RRP43